MGRTLRRRVKKKKSSATYAKGCELSYVEFMKWLVANEWVAITKLSPAVFANTSRGLMAKVPIKSGDDIVKIPSRLLITVNTVSKSDIGWLFNSDKSFSTQQVLATFLVWEDHLESISEWKAYVGLLPKKFESPLFCKDSPFECFPPFIKDKIKYIKEKVKEMYEDLTTSLSSKKCVHCNKNFTDIFTKHAFLWAWYSVNSRAVYMSPSHNPSNFIKLYDENNLALAPYLDLLNHSNEAKVQAYLREDDGSYCLRTLVPYEKYDEVFIHYGSHSNVKLFIEYGFILPENRNDLVMFELADISQAISKVMNTEVQCYDSVYKFLKSHDMLTSLYCNADGLSWNARAVIFVMLYLGSLEIKEVYRKVFSAGFSDGEFKEIAKVGQELVDLKKQELVDYTNKVKNSFQNQTTDNAVLLGLNLLSTLLSVLEKSKCALETCINV